MTDQREDGGLVFGRVDPLHDGQSLLRHYFGIDIIVSRLQTILRQAHFIDYGKMKSFQPVGRWLSFSRHGAQTPALPVAAGRRSHFESSLRREADRTAAMLVV